MTSPDGVKLSVQEWGNPNGPAILFVHGYSQAYLSWMRQVTDPEMAKRFRMVTFDLRGHGNSDKPNDKAAYHENKRWADDVKAIIDELKIDKPVLVGWSYAGRVVSDYLMAYGDGGVSGVNYVAAMTKAETNAGAPAGTPRAEWESRISSPRPARSPNSCGSASRSSPTRRTSRSWSRSTNSPRPMCARHLGGRTTTRTRRCSRA